MSRFTREQAQKCAIEKLSRLSKVDSSIIPTDNEEKEKGWVFTYGYRSGRRIARPLLGGGHYNPNPSLICDKIEVLDSEIEED